MDTYEQLCHFVRTVSEGSPVRHFVVHCRKVSNTIELSLYSLLRKRCLCKYSAGNFVLLTSLSNSYASITGTRLNEQ